MDDDVLRLLAAAQGHVFARAQASHLSAAAVRWRLSTGRWVIIRRGVYAEAEVVRTTEADRGDGGVRRHALDLAALRLTVGSGTAISHHSAARLHGIPALEPTPPPRFTSIRGSVRRGGDYWRNVAQLPAEHLSAGGLLTSPARTVVDLSREVGFAGGVVAADAALRAGLVTATELGAVVEACRDWPGARTAAEVARFADARAESPHESLCRVACHEGGLPTPQPQLWIADHDGFLFARADLGWEDRWTLLEADGAVKYRGLQPGPADPLVLEKRRQERLDDLGWEVVRVLWAESRWHRASIVAKLERAFARAHRRHAA